MPSHPFISRLSAIDCRLAPPKFLARSHGIECAGFAKFHTAEASHFFHVFAMFARLCDKKASSRALQELHRATCNASLWDIRLLCMAEHLMGHRTGEAQCCVLRIMLCGAHSATGGIVFLSCHCFAILAAPLPRWHLYDVTPIATVVLQHTAQRTVLACHRQCACPPVMQAVQVDGFLPACVLWVAIPVFVVSHDGVPVMGFLCNRGVVRIGSGRRALRILASIALATNGTVCAALNYAVSCRSA